MFVAFSFLCLLSASPTSEMLLSALWRRSPGQAGAEQTQRQLPANTLQLGLLWPSAVCHNLFSLYWDFTVCYILLNRR